MTTPQDQALEGRAVPVHSVRHVAHNIPGEAARGSVLSVRLTLENTGSLTWLAHSASGDQVGLAVFWDGVVVVNHPLPRPSVAPGESVTMLFALDVPAEPGRHELSLKLVQYHVTVFEDAGSPALDLMVEVPGGPLSREAKLWATMQRVDPWQHLPTRGIPRSMDGRHFPVFIERSRGCHVWDTRGNRFIDYTMGWGTMLLGYAHPAVTRALHEVIETGSLVAWPQPVEIEVAEMLAEDFPSAEMVAFGKNGSDASTFAVRMARLTTGRKVILSCGYNGWQDWWVELNGFEATGVPDRDPVLIHKFPFPDLEAFRQLMREHGDDVAAVIVEPSPWVEGVGFGEDTQASFLRTIADETRAAGALFVLDEIVTGYRYPGFSVQASTGVIPDLTCLGKAIAAGMPLSAVVGRADIFKESLPRTVFMATFHGEVYSLAAAKAAIEVYRTEPVVQHVWDYGRQLMDGVHQLCEQLGVEGRFRGTPFRMCFRFDREDPEQLHLERTLLQQELLKCGVTTYAGVMLPSYAHDEQSLSETLSAFGRSLEVVSEAARTENWHERLEIPPLLDL